MALKIDTQLMLLKTMTVRTGVIHDAQLLQLKIWPRLITGVGDKTKVELDQEHHLVRFLLETDDGFRLTKKTKRFMEEISIWIKFLLWDDTDVVFVAKGRVVHDTRHQ